jgi:sterol 24-C-methyltransferase
MSFIWQPIVNSLTGKSAEDKSLASHGSNEEVDKVLKEYTSLYENNEESVEDRKKNYAKMVNHYFDLVTDFYEYGWGHSFHFATRFQGESFDASIARHEKYLALKLGLKPGMTVVDLGCGIGGPMRCISRFSGCSVVGVNNNDYQVARCNTLNKKLGLDDICKAEKGDFLNLKFEPGTFDAAYAIEATCHAPERVLVFEQIFKVLKPGGLFVSYEWTTTDKYDPENEYHRQVKRDIEEGDSLPDLIHYNVVLKDLRDAGFEVLEDEDLALEKNRNTSTWYASLQAGYTPSTFRHTKIGTAITHYAVSLMETVGIAPKGSTGTHTFLSKARDSLQTGGELGIFTPMYFVMARKPL